MRYCAVMISTITPRFQMKCTHTPNKGCGYKNKIRTMIIIRDNTANCCIKGSPSHPRRLFQWQHGKPACISAGLSSDMSGTTRYEWHYYSLPIYHYPCCWQNKWKRNYVYTQTKCVIWESWERVNVTFTVFWLTLFFLFFCRIWKWHHTW